MRQERGRRLRDGQPGPDSARLRRRDRRDYEALVSEALEQVVLLVRTQSWDSVDPPQADLSLVRMAPSLQGKPRTEGK